MPAATEAVVLELRRVHRYWGPRRIRHEIARRRLVQASAVPSESPELQLGSSVVVDDVGSGEGDDACQRLGVEHDERAGDAVDGSRMSSLIRRWAMSQRRRDAV
jgi:hypothetical protein